MSDDALVTLDIAHMTGTVASFRDVGFMAIDPATLTSGGIAQQLPAGVNGAYIQYVGHGTQDFATGVIHYTDLEYELVAYTGKAQYPISTGSDPTVSGTTNTFVIAHGDLLQGNLYADQTNAIHGEVDVSVMSGLNGANTLGKLAITVDHPTGDALPVPGHFTVSPTMGVALPNAMTLYGGTLQATFTPT